MPVLYLCRNHSCQSWKKKKISSKLAPESRQKRVKNRWGGVETTDSRHCLLEVLSKWFCLKIVRGNCIRLKGCVETKESELGRTHCTDNLIQVNIVLRRDAIANGGTVLIVLGFKEQRSSCQRVVVLTGKENKHMCRDTDTSAWCDKTSREQQPREQEIIPAFSVEWSLQNVKYWQKKKEKKLNDSFKRHALQCIKSVGVNQNICNKESTQSGLFLLLKQKWMKEKNCTHAKHTHVPTDYTT